MTFADYVKYSPENVILRMAQVADEITGLYSEIAFTRQTEMDEELAGWQQSQAGTVSERRQDAKTQAQGIARALLDLEARLKGLNVEYGLLKEILDFKVKM